MDSLIRFLLPAAAALWMVLADGLSSLPAQEEQAKSVEEQPPAKLLVYIGTYTRGSDSK